MSNNPIEPKKTVVVSAEVKAPATSQGSITTSLKSSPIFGWFYAGADMLSAELDQVAGLVSKQIDKTTETLQEMQSKGIEVEADLRRSLSPFAFLDAAQNLVKSSSVYSVFSGGQKQQRKAQQIDELSAKVDALVEQVALLAAKEAVKQAEKKATPKRAPAKTAARASSKPTAKATSKASTTKAAAARASKTSSGKTTASASGKTTATVKAEASKSAAKTTASKTATKVTASKPSTKAAAAKASKAEDVATPTKAASATVSTSTTDKKND